MTNNLEIVIFTGHFGSGKTEMAINYGLNIAKTGRKTILVDIDVVNPFFRTHDVKSVLEEQGIEVIAPTCVGTTMDLPALPAKIQSVFNQKDATVIFDVGGDDDGARVLSRYKQYFAKVDYKMYFVINTRRPFTSTSEDIIDLMNEIELKSRLKIAYLVSNSNLAGETTIEVVEEGSRICQEVAAEFGTQIAYKCVPNTLKNKQLINDSNIIFEIERYMDRI